MSYRPVAGSRCSRDSRTRFERVRSDAPVTSCAASRVKPPRNMAIRANCSRSSSARRCHDASNTTRMLRCRCSTWRRSVSRKSRLRRISCRISGGLTTSTHEAARRMASGLPPTARQIVAIAARSPLRGANAGEARRALCRNSSTALNEASASIGASGGGTSMPSSLNTVSSRRPRRSREVARIVTRAAALRMSDTTAAPFRRCSKLSRSSSTHLSARCAASWCACGIPGLNASPIDSPIVVTMCSASRSGVSGTKNAPSGNPAIFLIATSCATRVFPLPPVPSTVIMRTAGSPIETGQCRQFLLPPDERRRLCRNVVEACGRQWRRTRREGRRSLGRRLHIGNRGAEHRLRLIRSVQERLQLGAHEPHAADARARILFEHPVDEIEKGGGSVGPERFEIRHSIVQHRLDDLRR